MQYGNIALLYIIIAHFIVNLKENKMNNFFLRCV